jgi:hypothetical protein
VSEVIAAAVLVVAIVVCWGPMVMAIRAGRRLWIALSAVWLLLTLIPLGAFAIPELTYWAAWARCGKQPAIASNFAAGDWYDLPGDIGYGPSIFAAAYFGDALEVSLF